MTTDEAYLAIKTNDVAGFRAFLTDTRLQASPNTFGLMESFMGYAIDQEKPDIVELLVCDAGMSKQVLQNWFVKWSWWIKPNYKIWKFLTDQCLDA